MKGERRGQSRPVAPWDGADFTGAKIAILAGAEVVVLRRDDIAGIDWPGRIDLPGGAREAGESPLGTALRETREEVALIVPDRAVVFGRCHPPRAPQDLPSWFFAARMARGEALRMRLGNEGQACRLMPVADFLAAADAVPHLQERLAEALRALD